MTGDELKSALSDIGMSQGAFSRLLTKYSTGEEVSVTTVNRWCSGRHPVPAAVALCVTLLRRIREDEREFLAKGRE